MTAASRIESERIVSAHADFAVSTTFDYFDVNSIINNESDGVKEGREYSRYTVQYPKNGKIPFQED